MRSMSDRQVSRKRVQQPQSPSCPSPDFPDLCHPAGATVTSASAAVQLAQHAVSLHIREMTCPALAVMTWMAVTLQGPS